MHGQTETDLDLRVMAWNVWSATLAALDVDLPHELRSQNRIQLIEFLRERDADVIFMVETYGSGEVITDGLNEGRPESERYAGIPITRDMDDPSDHRDNLWLFTRLPVVEVFPTVNAGVTTSYNVDHVTSFNFGGVRAALPSGQTICLFTTWLFYLGGALTLADDAVWDAVHGLPPRHSTAEVLATEDYKRSEMARTILAERIPAMVHEGEPVLLGGDFNTLSHLDWTTQFADAPGHGGLTFDWPVMKAFDEAGFVDLYRTVHPDAARFPGRTWSPYRGTGTAPGRIDFVLARGTGIEPTAARSDGRRLPRHADFPEVERFPFYSDHGSVTVDLQIAGAGPRPWPALSALPTEEPLAAPEPDGRAIPAEELTVTASSELADHPASNALNTDAGSVWRSGDGAPPHTLRLDLGRPRELTALRYQPGPRRSDGIIIEYEVRLSEDGHQFHTAARGEFGNTSLPSVVPLDGNARHLELIAIRGYNDAASALQVEVFEV